MFHHQPVLLSTVLDLLKPSPGNRVLDVTVGLGGHSSSLADAIGAHGTLICLDADEENLNIAQQRLSSKSARTIFIHSNFSCVPHCLPREERAFDCILADLGLSSPHLDDSKRGFSFKGHALLDMRYDRTGGRTAADVLNESTEAQLRSILRTYGELSHVHAIINAIVKRRKSTPFQLAEDLVAVASECFGYRTAKLLPQLFQALRIAVNDELASLEAFLVHAPLLLSLHGRLCIISYHSLEDRLVKHAFAALSSVQKHPVTGAAVTTAEYNVITKKSVCPTPEEIENNPRARSARLRVIERVSL